MSHLAIPRTFTLPRRVYVEEPSLRGLVADACNRWNALLPGLFLVVDEPAAPVHVVRGERTWVLMPVSSAESIVHWGGEMPPQWLAHELGHTLGLGDHLWPNFDAAGRTYIGAQVDEPGDSGRYRGVMSYLDPPDGWFGEDDRRMLAEHFGGPVNGVALPMVASS